MNPGFYFTHQGASGANECVEISMPTFAFGTRSRSFRASLSRAPIAFVSSDAIIFFGVLKQDSSRSYRRHAARESQLLSDKGGLVQGTLTTGLSVVPTQTSSYWKIPRNGNTFLVQSSRSSFNVNHSISHDTCYLEVFQSLVE